MNPLPKIRIGWLLVAVSAVLFFSNTTVRAQSPVIQVQQPAGTDLVSGSSTVDYGSLVLGTTNQLVYTISNSGSAPLTNLSAVFTGSGASQFSALFSGTTVGTGSNATVTVTYLATQSGSQAATFSITSNDPVTPSFDTTATGTGLAIDGTFTSASQPLISANNYYPAGIPIDLALDFVPSTGATLTVVSNTGSAYITGTFNNLAQGQLVPLTNNGVTFNFSANYYGGATGKDLTLQWADNLPFGWGNDASGQIVYGGTGSVPLPTAMNNTDAIAGKTIAQVSAGQDFSLALCTDGRVVQWGESAPTDFFYADGTTIIAISAGAQHALALTSSGTALAWGDNTYGQLGISGTLSLAQATPVDSSTDSALNGKFVVAIAAGGTHSLALSSDGSLEAWGNNASGQLGDGGAETSSTTPILVDSSSDSALFGKTVTAIAAGANHSLALCSDGSVAAWGANASGQLGDSGSANSLIPVAVDSSTDSALNGKIVIAVSAGTNHSLALCKDGTLLAWGDNSAGELGNGGTNSSLVPVAVTQSGVLSGKTVTAIAAGNNFSLALCSDGSVAAWGDNSFGQLGVTGSQAYADVPVTVDASNFPIAPSMNAPVLAIAAGPAAQTSLAIVAEQGSPVIEVQQPAGTNLVSGSSTVDFGALVLGTTNQLTYTIVNDGQAPLTNLAVAITGSDAGQFTSGTLSTTTLGSGSSTTVTVTYLATQTGTQTATLSVTSNDPATPSFDTALTGTGLAIDGTFTSGTQALVSANNYYPSGIPINLALGFAPPVGSSLTIVSNSGAMLISGTYSNLAQGQLVQLTFDGVTYDFIANYYGGTGNDLVLEWASTNPVAWGLNANGQLGTGGTANGLTPVAVDGTSITSGTVTELAAGSAHSLALTSAGAVFSWGDNTYGQLGTGGTSGSLAPVAVDSSTASALNGKTVVAITAGSIHSLALSSDGSIAAWGYGADGELGAGGTATSFEPIAVDSSTASALNGRTVKAISAGSFHNMVLCTDGSVITWGYNIAGQLGTGGTSNSSEPVLVTSASGTALFGNTVTEIAAGRDFSLALCTVGTSGSTMVAAWGDNSAGQLGVTGTASALTPVVVNSSSGSALFGKTVVAIAAGGYHSLALCSDGTVVAWGYNGIGELGDGTMVSSTLPVIVSTAGALGGKTVTAVAAGLFHSLAYCSDGSVAAWGWDQYGQLGDGASVLPYSATPVGVDTTGFVAGHEFYSVATGPAASHTLALAAAPASGQPLTYTITPSVTGTEGTLSPNVPQTVSSGGSVTFTATSGTGYTVSQWLVNGQVVQTVGNTYTLSNVTANTSVSVSFAPAQKVSAANTGVYEGLFLDGSGLINLSLSANGKFSGKVTIDGTAHAISGTFNASGEATATNLKLQLAGGVGGTPGSYFINGSYNGDPLTAWHAAYAKGATASEAGTYTVQVAAVSRAATVPQIKSTVTLVIAKTGAVKFSGKLPDGQSFSTTAIITGGPSGNQFFIYTTLAYKNLATAGQHGFLTGDLSLASGAVNGPLLWTKPAQKNGAWPAAFETGLIITQ